MPCLKLIKFSMVILNFNQASIYLSIFHQFDLNLIHDDNFKHLLDKLPYDDINQLYEFLNYHNAFWLNHCDYQCV